MKTGPLTFQWACLAWLARSMASARRSWSRPAIWVRIFSDRSFFVLCMVMSPGRDPRPAAGAGRAVPSLAGVRRPRQPKYGIRRGEVGYKSLQAPWEVIPRRGAWAGTGICRDPRRGAMSNRWSTSEPAERPGRKRSMKRLTAVSLTLLALAAAPALAQSLTLPPSGDNQRSEVSQSIGLVKVTIVYNSPNVHAPDGTDRKGKIWGTLVPYGMANLGFGTCGDQCPWRGGANENTVFTTSHDVKVQGQPLPAGSYGVHFIPGKDEWTVAFSKNHTSWGSFFYDAKEDALRVQAKPEKSEYHEWLTYEFTDRQPDKATLALKWEDLQLPLHITVDDIDEVYFAAIRNELRTSPGFDFRNWEAAA